MKVYSIGRDNDCDIVIIDNHNIVSRRHATLNVSPTGKMTITDTSHNGTYVNGMLISSNVPFPVTRKDTVSFAHIAQLDWACIPNPLWYVKYVIAGVVALIVILLVTIFSLRSCDKSEEPVQEDETPVTNVQKATEDSLKAKEDAKKDSISNAVEKQIRKAKDDAKAKKDAKNKAADKKTDKNVNADKAAGDAKKDAKKTEEAVKPAATAKPANTDRQFR